MENYSLIAGVDWPDIKALPPGCLASINTKTHCRATLDFFHSDLNKFDRRFYMSHRTRFIMSGRRHHYKQKYVRACVRVCGFESIQVFFFLIVKVFCKKSFQFCPGSWFSLSLSKKHTHKIHIPSPPYTHSEDEKTHPPLTIFMTHFFLSISNRTDHVMNLIRSS